VNYKASGFVFLYTVVINAYRTLVEKSEGKRPQRSPRRRLEECIKMDLKDQDKMTRRRFFRLRRGKVVGCCKYGN